MNYQSPIKGIFLDTETHALEGNICEAAVIPFGFTPSIPQVVPMFTIQRFSRFNPLEKIDYAAMAVHHITDADVAGCKPHTEAYTLIYDLGFWPEAPIYVIGHNVDYDIRAMGRSGINVSLFRPIDTMVLARHVWPNASSYSLSALTLMNSNSLEKTISFIKDHAHNALGDLKMTVKLLNDILAALDNFNSIHDLFEFCESLRVPEFIPFGKHKGTHFNALPMQYVDWLSKQKDLDPYIAQAIKKHCRGSV